jgi:ABC-2 type transport system ATP-binding protein
VLFSSHLLEEVERVADDVAMIHEGEVVMCDSIEKIRTSHHFVTLRFPEPIAEQPQLPGVLSIEGKGQEWTALFNNELDEVCMRAKAMGCEIFQDRPPTLEDIFVARAGVDRSALREGE